MNFLTQLNDQIITDFFDATTIARGKNYFKQNKVISVDINDTTGEITSKVHGGSDKTYKTSILIERDSFSDTDITGECSCPVGFNCKHVVATLMAVRANNDSTSWLHPSHSNDKLDNAQVNNWLDMLRSETRPSQLNIDDTAPKKVFEFIYILKKSLYQQAIEVTLNVSKYLKAGGLGKPQKYSFTAHSHQNYLNLIDEEIVIGLQFLNQKQTYYYGSHSSLLLKGRQSTKWLKTIIETGRAYWEKISEKPLTLGPEAPLTFSWKLSEDASQSLQASINEDGVELFMLDSPWYLNKKSHMAGLLDSELSTPIIEALLKAPTVNHDSVQQVSETIKQIAPNIPSLLPLTLAEPIQRADIQPTPILQLDITKFTQDLSYYRDEILELPTAEIFFDYDGKIMPFSLANKEVDITYVKENTIYSIARQFNQEKKAILTLSHLVDLEDIGESLNPTIATRLVITSIDDEEDFLDFCLTTIPAIEYAGWRIERKHKAFLERVEEADVAWYSELDETSQYDYFGFSMGIILDGEQVNILPLIGELIRSTSAKMLKEISDEQTIPLPLPGGKILPVPFARIKSIINILIELYDSDLHPKSGFNLSKRQASLLYEIEKAFEASQMRWIGGEKLRVLGKKLSSFEAIQNIPPPKSFSATLRPYQQNGVNWLQFLREYELGGILADDMGLGKTIQTIAHLCIEKARGRMTKPSLIIAPTSLMTNWRIEITRFSSQLKVLVYHGNYRKQYNNQIKNYDVILTTYPLLLRDKAVLLEQSFYYLILDEAQYIKNSKTKGTQIIHQINAEHRLCLTGTPMENHLGELWSLFHFLMPGFLGSEKQFKTLFRTPIEKHQDLTRKKGLSLRIKPFMLRRLKNEVIQELPDKTEIIRCVELEGAQRDLYESIRLSMEKKVRDVIQQKGLARSHIVVLDALLKLRQVCCDPRLLKLDAAKKAHGTSAKMELLMEMLPEMVEEGRKILIFSQFTGMLEIIEESLKERALSYVKLTGSTKNREKPIQAFQEGDVPIFLISLKAGGTGLNLTAADIVIHYDPWWNPAVEDQATDRAHRIGQKKSIFVYKLQVSGTVEETIQLMQHRKRELTTGLFSEEAGEEALTLSGKDLEALFKPLASAIVS